MLDTQFQPIPKPSETAIKMVSLMGWKWLWCAMSAVEITPTVAEVYTGRMWEKFHSPTFADNKRVRDVERLENGDYRVMLQLAGNDHHSAIVLQGDDTLLCFVPTPV